MIKPSAVKDSNIGAIIQIIEKAHLHIVALKMQTITKEEAEAFYAEHKNRSFFPELVSIMTSGPIVAMCVEGENAISHLRQVVGATDPKKAALGTIRALFGKSVGENAIHASDSDTNAAREIAFFFSQEEICQ